MDPIAKRIAALALALVSTSAGSRFATAADDVSQPEIAQSRKPASSDPEACKETGAAAEEARSADQSIADAQAVFSLDLLSVMAADPGSGTVSISPAGLAAVFSGLALGADETMRVAIAKMLRLPAAGKGSVGLDRLRAALRLLDLGRDAGQLQGTDAVFVDRAIPLKAGIAARLQAEARIPVKPTDLGTQEGVETVNQFVSQATRGRIPTILDAPPQSVALVAVNAFHFKDCWSVAFNPADTRKKLFQTVGGIQSDVAMMRLDEKPLAHVVKGRFAAVDLVYRNADFSMTLVTTRDKPEGVKAFAQAAKLLAGNEFHIGLVELVMPVFGAENSSELLQILAGLGLRAGLDAPKALSGFADGIRLGAVHQKTFVAVDEEGTVAAAATAAVATRSVAGPQPERISFDKPFVFALRHRPTGLLLMAGYVGQPKLPSNAPAR